ncbi:MAG: hypothetical protein ABIX01_10385 [Chitinophagaceae bacterium]
MKKITLVLVLIIAIQKVNRAQAVDVAQFGLKADFKRMTVSLQGNTVTATNYQFSAADVGKVIAIKNARLYAAYTSQTLSLNAIIKDVKNQKAIIESPHQSQAVNVQNTEALMGTNNFDAIQKGLDYCAANGKKQLLLNYTGTAYVVPFFSELCRSHGRNDGGNTSGFILKGNIEIKGLGKEKTKIKTGAEDLVYLKPEEEFQFDLFYADAVPNGVIESKIFRDFTIIGADRASTAIRNNNVVCRTSYADFQVMKVLFERVDIEGKAGFDAAFTTSRGGRWNSNGTVKDFCEYTIRDCNWSNYQPLAIFSQVPAQHLNAVNGAKKLLIEGSTFDGGGIPILKKYTDAGTVNGKTLSMSVPGFSYYNFNSYIPERDRYPVIGVENALKCVIRKLVNNFENTKDLELDKSIAYTIDYFDVYVTDALGKETFIRQAGHSVAGSNQLHLVTGAMTGDIFKQGNKLRLILQKARCRVTGILSPTTANIEWIDGNITTISNATILFNDDGRMAEGHTMYIHPNVSCLFRNLTIMNALKLALHHYSGGGVLGQRLYFEMDGVKQLPTNDYVLENGKDFVAPFEFTMENNPPGQPIVITNSSFKLYQTSAVLKATNCNLLGGQCDGGSFDNCTGGIDIWGGAATSFTNCSFDAPSVLRAREGLALNVKVTSSYFAYLHLQNLNSFTMTGGKINYLDMDPGMKAKEGLTIKMNKVQILSRR